MTSLRSFLFCDDFNHNKITQLIVQTELLSTHQFWQFDNVWKLEKIFDIQIFETHIDEMNKAY